jgi:hypothetical protein
VPIRKLGLTASMSALVVENRTRELSSDCAWTHELVELSAGDLYLDGQQFGSYIAACYPDSDRSPQFIINVLDATGRPLLSLPCEYTPHNAETVRPMRPEDSPWSEDGVMIGPVPSPAERSIYSQAREALLVAKALVKVEPQLSSWRGPTAHA